MLPGQPASLQDPVLAPLDTMVQVREAMDHGFLSAEQPALAQPLFVCLRQLREHQLHPGLLCQLPQFHEAQRRG